MTVRGKERDPIVFSNFKLFRNSEAQHMVQ